MDEGHDASRVPVSTMEIAGSHMVGADSAASAAREGLNTMSLHGEQVATISRRIADETRRQSASGNDIANHLNEIVGWIEQTSTSIAEVTTKTIQMKETLSQLRHLIGCFRFIR
jgi:methyl-accepting chemotaxis protein